MSTSCRKFFKNLSMYSNSSLLVYEVDSKIMLRYKDGSYKTMPVPAVLEKSLQEEETVTVTVEKRDYTVHSKDEKSINYEVNAIGKQIEKKNNLEKIKKEEEEIQNFYKNETKDDEKSELPQELLDKFDSLIKKCVDQE